MAHFAKIEDGIVTNIIVIDNEHEADGQEYINGLGIEGTWIQTSYNGNFRGQYAIIGGTYDEVSDIFIGPEPEIIVPELEIVVDSEA